MKRTLGSLVVMAAAAWSMGQSAFTIVRPADGSKVRETIRVLFPMSSVPDNSYVGIYIGGKFVEAVVPGKGANYLYYDIDTKARAIPGGPLTIEAFLFQDVCERPRIVDRSSVQVTVSNSANIPIPDDGLKLRYKFKAGTEWVYKITQRIAVSDLSESMAKSTSQASLLAGADTETVRLKYSIDNTYSGGDGLLRIQPVADKGKHTLTLTSDTSDQAETYENYQVHPVYMRVRNTGWEVFGNIPRYFPLEGSAGEGFRTDLFAVFPLPTLPSTSEKPGSTFPSRFQLSDLNLDQIDESKTLVSRKDARGEFVAVEWQNGHPCARLHNSFSISDPNSVKASSDGSKSTRSQVVNAQAIDENIWFALDLGTVVKMVRTFTIDRRIEAAVGTNTGGAGAAGAGAGPRRQGAASAGGGDGRASTGASIVNSGDGRSSTGINLQGGPGRGGQGGAPRGARGGQTGPPGGVPQGPPDPRTGQFGGGNRNGGAPAGGGAGTTGRGSGSTTRIVRISYEQVFELEK